MIYIGEVQDNRDFNQGGRLDVMFHEYPKGKTLRGCSPSVGRDSGFFFMPEVGSKVIVTQAHSKKDEEGEWIWVAGLWDPTFVPDKEVGTDNDIALSMGNPNSVETYAGNDSPQKAIIKTPGRHTIELSDKVRKDNSDRTTPIQEDHIKFYTSTGKKILIDDGVGKGHDRIFLGDGKDRENYILIQGGKDIGGPNQIKASCKNNMFFESDEGCIRIEIGKESIQDITIVNDGKGDITIKSKNKVNVVADTVDVDASKVSVDADTVNINGAGGDVKVGGISLVNHKHSGVESGGSNTGGPV